MSPRWFPPRNENPASDAWWPGARRTRRMRSHSSARVDSGYWDDAYWIVPQELIDLGDRYLIILQMAGHAGRSTLTVTQPAAILEELDDRGMIIREQRFTDPPRPWTCSDWRKTTSSASQPSSATSRPSGK